MKVFLLFLSLLFIINARAQTNVISGYVKDSASGEALIGASVALPALHKGTVTNNYGYFSLTLPANAGKTITISYVAHNSVSFEVTGKETASVYLLSASDNRLQNIIVSSGKRDANVQKARMGTIDISVKDIKTIPLIAGERDVLKVIQFLPGVQGGNEGTTSFFVRGGNTDQNLILLDEAVIYNPNHLFGLFSTFNVNALKNVTLIKGGFPAQYGGRLSSVLDITMKDGNKNKLKGEGGIGLLSGNLTLEGPLQKGKSSFILSARRSYIDLLSKPFIPKNKNNTSYYLYDINAKANFELSKHDQLFLSFFKGNDKAAYTGASSLNYGIHFGNSAVAIRWNHLFQKKVFLNTSLITSDYHLSLSTAQNNYYSLLYSSVRDWTAKSTAEWHPNTKHSITGGAQYTYHLLTPSAYSAKIPKKGSRYNIRPDSLQPNTSNEMAIFVNDEYVINSAIGINAGLRAPIFTSGKKTYTALEPRLTLKVSVSPTASVKVAYTDMTQFLHLVPNSTASLPTDIWLSSSTIVKPQQSRQAAAGYFRNFKENKFESSIELYYKTMQHQVLFKEGAQVTDQTNIDELLTFGKGQSYGAELFIRKNTGRLTGWLAYTLSKTTQQFDSLNYSKTFPFTYDRRHLINIVTSYQLTNRWSFAANFVFNTGNAFTMPAGRATVFMGGSLYDNNYYDYSSRNNYRLRAYNRLDVSASYKKQRKIFGKRYDSEWVFSIYNLYSRTNPYFIYLTVDANTGKPLAKQVSLLPVIPAVSYNFSF